MSVPAIEPHHLRLLAKELAWHYRVVPFGGDIKRISAYCHAVVDRKQLATELEIITGSIFELTTIAEADLDRLLGTHYIVDQTTLVREFSPTKNAEHFLDDLINEARNLKSSDIHVEAYERFCRVRIRIDGTMVERHRLKIDDYPALINKIKIKSNLDIAEKRLPQDGRFVFENKDDPFDIRVSVLPTIYGEKIVLRLLNSSSVDVELSGLGFSSLDLDRYLLGIRRPQGILLISGPTGSGKTTTLYATLKELNKETRNILTIEDPVEYTLPGVNQVQLKESIGFGFPEALRTFLRQDPDVIMVGEIRDVATANMAIRAAQTGHLVLSTIHTNSAWGTVARLTDMGVPPFLLAATLNTSVAQRLIRLLCDQCKRQAPFDDKSYPPGFEPKLKISHHNISHGCASCHYTGYRGRKAVYEIIPIDAELGVEIKKGNLSVTKLLAERNIRTLAQNAFDLFADGLTSIDEIYPLLLNY